MEKSGAYLIASDYKKIEKKVKNPREKEEDETETLDSEDKPSGFSK